LNDTAGAFFVGAGTIDGNGGNASSVMIISHSSKSNIRLAAISGPRKDGHFVGLT
jgi:hypothetical protein